MYKRRWKTTDSDGCQVAIYEMDNSKLEIETARTFLATSVELSVKAEESLLKVLWKRYRKRCGVEFSLPRKKKGE